MQNIKNWEMQQYSRKKAEKIVAIPARRIQFYSDSGLLSLDVQTPGRGRERIYSTQNLLELMIIKELAKQKIELSRIKKILRDNIANLAVGTEQKIDYIAKLKRGEGLPCVILYGDGSIDYLSNLVPSSARIPMSSHSSMVVFNIGTIAEKLMKKISSFHKGTVR